MLIRKLKPFNATLLADADKSITHRALILGAAADGVTRIINPSFCADCVSTLNCLKTSGVKISQSGNILEVYGGIKSGEFSLDAGNSGTTLRLLTGLFAGKVGVTAFLSGDESLKKRPMGRITEPLKSMGAEIEFCGGMINENGKKNLSVTSVGGMIYGGTTNENSKKNLSVTSVGGMIYGGATNENSKNFFSNVSVGGGNLPLKITGKKLKGIEYSLPIASAQLKSALLIAGLCADGVTVLSGEIATRNHTEIMLSAMGARLEISEDRIRLESEKICGIEIEPAGDFSSAIYFLVLALLLKDSAVTVKNVNINPTRIAALELLKSCGAEIYLSNERCDIEKSADITAHYSKLQPFKITADKAQQMIDELPLLAVAACFIEGDSLIEGAGELRFKESDRISAIAEGLKKMGAKIDVLSDGLIIHGRGRLAGGCRVSSFSDHRIEMSLAIAAALSDNGAEVESGYTSISSPSFYKLLDKLTV